MSHSTKILVLLPHSDKFGGEKWWRFSWTKNTSVQRSPFNFHIYTCIGEIWNCNLRPQVQRRLHLDHLQCYLYWYPYFNYGERNKEKSVTWSSIKSRWWWKMIYAEHALLSPPQGIEEYLSSHLFLSCYLYHMLL